MSYSDETTETISTPPSDGPPQRPQPPRSNTGLIVGAVLAVLVLSLAGLAVAYFAFDAFSDEAHEARTRHEQISTLEPTVTTAPSADVAESPAVGTGTATRTGSASASGSTGAPSEPGITYFGPAPADAGTAGTDGATGSDHTPVAPAVAPEPEITSFSATGTDSCGPGAPGDRVLRNVVWSTANATRVELVYPGGATRDVGASGSAEVYVFCGDPPVTFILRAYNEDGDVVTGDLALVA